MLMAVVAEVEVVGVEMVEVGVVVDVLGVMVVVEVVVEVVDLGEGREELSIGVTDRILMEGDCLGCLKAIWDTVTILVRWVHISFSTESKSQHIHFSLPNSIHCSMCI